MDSELLFLLIIVLTVVINIVKAIKKKKAQAAQITQPEPAKTPQEGDWQKMLKELLGETASVPRPAPVYEDYESESLETLEPLGGYIQEHKPYNFDKPEYTRPSIQDEIFDVQPGVQAVPDSEYSLNIASVQRMHETLRDFDIRKAVIYSTILNRPYN